MNNFYNPIYNRQPINQAQFKQMVSSVSDNMLQQLVQAARTQGISDADIEAGLIFIKQLK